MTPKRDGLCDISAFPPLQLKEGTSRTVQPKLQFGPPGLPAGVLMRSLRASITSDQTHHPCSDTYLLLFHQFPASLSGYQMYQYRAAWLNYASVSQLHSCGAGMVGRQLCPHSMLIILCQADSCCCCLALPLQQYVCLWSWSLSGLKQSVGLSTDCIST